MKKYLSFFRLRFITGLQYRTAALAGIATQFFWGAMEILTFRAFYQSDPASFPMTLQATSSYIWIQQAFLVLFMGWNMEAELFDAIRDGNISYELCRPLGIYHMWFARSLAYRLSCRAALPSHIAGSGVHSGSLRTCRTAGSAGLSAVFAHSEPGTI